MRIITSPFIQTIDGCLEWHGRGRYLLIQHCHSVSGPLQKYLMQLQTLLSGFWRKQAHPWFLDDFLLVGAPNSTECAHVLSIFLQRFGELGLPIALIRQIGGSNHTANISRPWVGLKFDGDTLPGRQTSPSAVVDFIMASLWVLHWQGIGIASGLLGLCM